MTPSSRAVTFVLLCCAAATVAAAWGVATGKLG